MIDGSMLKAFRAMDGAETPAVIRQEKSAHNNKLSGRTVRPEERIGVLDDSRDARYLVERRG